MTRIAVLTSGGDAPGMNAALRAVTMVAAQQGVQVFGIERGFEGLLDGSWRALSRKTPLGIAPTAELDASAHLGGSLLGSARCMAFYERPGRNQATAALREFDGLIVLGGNGSLTGARALVEEQGAKVIGIPASIDNDVGCTAMSIGVDTALNTIIEACDKISDTARAHRRAFVVEVMGRQSGYLCMAAAIAAGADAALFREDGRTEDELVNVLASTIQTGFDVDRGKQRILVLKAEGVDVPCTRLVRRTQELLDKTFPGVEVRATVLGHLVRGGNPRFLDRMIASRFALAAVSALLGGETGEMVAWQTVFKDGIPTVDRAVTRFPFARVLEETEALISGESAVTRRRQELMHSAAGVLAL